MREGRSYFARLKGGAALRDGVSDTNIVPREGWHRQGRMIQVRFKSSSSFIMLTVKGKKKYEEKKDLSISESGLPFLPCRTICPALRD